MRASGTFTNAIQYLRNKALKVIFMIRRRFQTEAINAKLFLKLFDTCVKHKNYLGVSVDKKIISQYSKLRISSHRLNIEVRRYTRTPVNLRMCNICSSSDIEDEFHLMCVCPMYSDIRNNLFEAISKFVVLLLIL